MEAAAQVINIEGRDFIEVQFKDDSGRAACIRLNPQTFLDREEAIEICKLLNQLISCSSAEGLESFDGIESLEWMPRDESTAKNIFGLSGGSSPYEQKAIEDCTERHAVVARCLITRSDANNKEQSFTLEELRAVLKRKVLVAESWLDNTRKSPTQPKKKVSGCLGPDDDHRFDPYRFDP